MEKFSYKTLFTIVVVLLIGIVALLRFQQKPTSVLAEWFNDAWMYRQAINISTHSVGETNVYISTSINIGTTTKSQPDNGDFRFTTSSGQLLDYYIVSGAGTTNISFHIKFDTFPSGAQTIYSYYGNSSANDGFSTSDFSTVASSYSIGTAVSEEVGGGPVAWYKFDEGVGTSAFDSSSSRNNSSLGTGSSSPSWVDESQCISGKCIKFDGNDYLTTSSYPSLSTELTYNLWIKRNNATGQQGLISINRTMLQITESQVDWYPDIDIAVVSQSTTLNANQWYMITVTQSGTSYSIYKDGKLIKTGTTSAIDTTNSFKLVGTYQTGLRPYNGVIDDVKIYPYARSAAQIKQDYTSGLAGQSSSNSSVNIGSNSSKGTSDGLIAYWKFDEGVGTSSSDSSGNSNTPIFTGTSAPTWANGKYGIGMSFDNNNDYFNTALSNVNGTAGGYNSVSYWMYWQGNTNDIVFSFGAYYDLWFNSATCFGFNTGSGEAYGFNPSSPSIANRWVHVVANFYNGAYTGKNEIYIDGVKQTLTQCAGSAQSKTLATSLTFILGNLLTGGGYSFGGLIDEFRIYNRALTVGDVKNLYNFAPGPAAYWKFDEGNGTTGSDSSGNNRTATLQNGAGFAPGKYGHALSLNIGSSASQYASISDITHNYSFTKEAWINPIDTTQCSGTRCSVIGPYFEIMSNLQYYDYSMVASPGWHQGGSIPLNKWTHVAVSYDQSQVKLFVNGIQVVSTSVGSTNSHNSNYIGAVSPTTRNFRGYIDEVKIYDYARTAEQILQDMSGDSSSPHSNKPIAYYKFDEGSSNIAYNSGVGGSAIDGALGSGAASPSWNNIGKFGKALSFTAANNTVVRTPITTSNGLNIRGEVSYSIWFKRSTTSGYHTLIDMIDTCSASSTDGYLLRFNNNTLYFYGYIADAGGTDPFTLSYDTDGDTSSWHHTSVTWDGTTNTNGVKMYLDGKLVAQTTAVSTASNMATLAGYNLSLGTLMCNTHSLDGQLDELKIYNHAISADDVKSDYNAGSTFNFGSSSQAIGNTITSLDYCVPGDTSTCSTPIAEYKMDEGVGTTTYDTSGNNNDGTLGTGNSSPTWTIGKIGKALKFDGVVNGFNANDMGTLSTYTVEAWIKPNEVTNYDNLFHWSSSNSYISIKDGICFYATSWSCSSTTPTVGQWSHIAVTSNGNVYQNGVSTGIITPETLSGVLRVGYRPDTSVYNYNGQLDQVRIYNYARTPAQIAYDYNRGGPVGWWKMDECQGTVVNDSSGIGNSGTITIGSSGSQNSLGTCTVGTSAAWTSGVTGKVNSSLMFDGVDDFVQIGTSNPITGSQPFTLAGWLKTGSHSTYGLGFYIGGASSSQSAWLGWTAAAQQGTSNSIGGGFYGTNYGSGITDTNWHHVVMTYAGGTNGAVYLYVDGIKKVSTTYTANLAATSIMMGKTNTGTAYWYNGQIDDARIYNYPLTSTQIKAIYNGGSINFK